MIEGGQAILPRDLLPFFIVSSAVRYRNLIDPAIQLGKFCCDFGLESKTVGLDRELCQKLAAEDLVAGFHVGKVQVGQHVGNQRQELVAHVVPKK